MKKVKRVFLGNSLTSNILAGENDVVIDFWEGGSNLYGWTIGPTCLDRIPIFLTKNCCQRVFNGALREIDVEAVVEGSETNLREKMGDISNSFLGYYGRLLIPERWVCDHYREFLRRSKTERIFSPTLKIDLESRVIKTHNYKLEYEELVNTLPLHYFLTKAGLSSQLTYTSAYILALVVKTRLREFTKFFIGHRGYLLGLVVSYRETPIGRIIYAFIPLSRESMKAELTNRAVVELKKLKFIEEPIRLARSFYSKYFRLKGYAREVGEFLKKYNVSLAGRYGSWSEISICDICQ